MTDSGDSLFAPADDALVGRVIGGKFALRSCVGIGSSGTVYRADQTSLGRTVAVKVLRPELAADPRFVRRFHDEALAASRLNHPNVVSVIDFGQTEDGLLYLVMEFLRGSTLTQVLRSEALSDARVADLLGQILSALEEAHEAGVVHADLKADNIVVERRRGDWDLVKVVDFGIARLVGQNEDADDFICGTPEYMAPEVIRGEDPTFASDLYSVGVLLYELLTGATPFTGAGSMEVLRRHVEDLPRPPSERHPERTIHPVLEQVALRALAKEPAERFADATAFREALSDLRQQSDDDEVLCAACGTRSAPQFKFCPECGQPRQNVARTEEIPALPARPEIYSDETPTADLTQDDVAALIGHPANREPAAVDAGILPLPLVGRETELARLEGLLLGPPGVALHLAGPLGVGRTRLLREACTRAAGRGAVVYLADPDPSGLGSPFYPVRSMVAAILGLPPLCAYEDLGVALEDIGLSRRDLPGIGELFGHEGGLWQLDPAVRRRELAAATIRVLRAAGRGQSTALAFEDVDRYDQPSLDLLRRLAEANQRAPVLRLLLTSRDTLQLGWSALERLELPRLGEAALGDLVEHLEQRSHGGLVSESVLAEAAERLPGHMHQLIRFGVEGGDVALAPEALADLIGARLDLLCSDARLAIQAIAVFGVEAPRAGVEELLRGELESAPLRTALEVLEARGLVRAEGDVLTFERMIVREVAYEATPVHVRRQLHARAGDVLAETVSDPALLGHHADKAGDLSGAAELLARGGDNALHQLDDLGASGLYNRALHAARRLMLEDDDNANRVRFVSTSIKLADTLRAAGEVALARGVVDEATGHCQDSPILRAQLLRASAHLHSSTGDEATAIATLRDAIGLVIPVGAPELLGELYLDLATMQLRGGRPDDARREIEEGIDVITAGEGAATTRAPRQFWTLLLRLAQLASSGGDPGHALPIAEQAHRHANQADSALGAARAQALLASIHEQLGDHARAEIYRRRAIEAMRDLGDRRGTAELLLSGARSPDTIRRITPASIREARLLAEEIGWSEGVRRAKRASTHPPARR